MESQLKTAEIIEYLRYLYFGEDKDIIKASLDRAFLDFNRTLWGLGKFPHKNEYIKVAKSTLYEKVSGILDIKNESQNKFDSWHKGCCDDMISAFEGFKFHYGQAQKWINMTMKYIFVLDQEKVNSNYQFLHIPIDNIIIDALKSYDAPKLSCSWSRIDDYQQYLFFSKLVQK
jgi:hypothetical protein